LPGLEMYFIRRRMLKQKATGDLLFSEKGA
jgi:hypothetical protein